MTSPLLDRDATRPAFDADYLDQLLARGIQVIRVIHADLFGRQRGKQYPVSSLPGLAKGIAYSKMANAEDLLGVPVDEKEFPALANHPDQHAYLDMDTAFVPPWESDSLWVLARLSEDGKPSALCPRSQLAAATARLHEDLGLRAVAAGEPEFYLFRKDGTGSRTPYAPDGVSYTMDRITDPDGAVGRIHRQLIEMNIGVTVVNREFSPGQFEINLAHNEALSAADSAFLLKTGIKELAVIEGLEANFMAKPVTGEEGSSLHVHLSLWQEDENVFAAPDGALSPAALAAIAGIQQHAPAIMAFAAPTVNSYKRLTGNGLSPRTSNWGEDNRFTFVRVPAERGGATRLELRAGDASASSHLLMAAMIHAAADGIRRGLVPDEAGKPLPRSLGESVAALEADEVLRAGFGDEFTAVYAALKRREIEAFEATVTDWEWNLYRRHV
ncbi:glutamine synthetase family protein [Arthrobacter sp. GCM10027362]|uniref:glutamine synthetase family protein n=1 Tax=Arthrobacter sp. GCM10027362 TaxID=3273379 RepID=UPI003645E452